MAVRTNIKTVTFNYPFCLAGMDEMQPAGAYEVETDEELLEGLSFTAWKRKLSLIRLPILTGNAKLTQTLEIDPRDLDDALRLDSKPRQEPDFAARFEKSDIEISADSAPDALKPPAKRKTMFQLATELKELVKRDGIFRAKRMARNKK